MNTHLSPTTVAQVCKDRSDMLASLSEDISPELQDRLRAKLTYEHESLRWLIESDTKAADLRTRMDKTLKAEYFERVPLDPNII